MTTELQNDLRARVIEMLKDNVDDSDALDQLGPDDELTVLGVNSVTFIKLVIAAEMEFGVTWKDEDLDFRNFMTINSIMNYILSSDGENE
ncbi:acyl carrier protein [Paenibacillus sp. ACRRX]|uniref:acyl carrier protein n=1 Tax=unclassified Paenibacillus TaxID=185978 RepID=UPI001EF70039|nr:MULTISPECIES: acyl carrier protein [unclassified Paenibacillus]MCG7407268.1 acyl carrier protein [Paenibacillus sp. ACRRX]MDK8180487.1 acyl carrier protein [Paenibacillus sp. UMB4589-SE434]